jgi:uncharacterized phage protein (TIGR01671 family)
MREIKFRGWHTVKKVMFSAEEMAADQLALLPTGEFINVHSLSTRLSEIYPKDEFIPLQYTGLKDKNGIEIYEGDIVRLRQHATYPNEVYFDERTSGFRMHFNGEMQFDKTTPLDFAKFGEVIGNIYENPELLENQ